MMSNLIEFEFKKGILVINIKFKITIINLVSILKRIYNIQSINKFKFIAVKFKNGEINVLLLYLLKLYISKINGYVIILEDDIRDISNSSKYYVVNNINYIYDIFSTIA